MTSISGRDPHTGRKVEVVIRDGVIAAVTDVPSADPAWLSTGLIDLQINGYQGFDLNADHLTSDTVIDLSRSVLATGVTTFLPTIITASEEKIIACLRAIAAARQLNPALQHMIPGTHVEGPHLSPEAGPRGAHPREHIRPPSISEFDRWQRASGDLVKLVTMSPHFDEAPNTTLQRCATEASSSPSATLTLHPSKSMQESTPEQPYQPTSATASTIRYPATLTSFGRN
jgi:N-acetylglucosamine-6-phosphate deacetylase